eukprot:3372557-Amphidinium_carterae.2
MLMATLLLASRPHVLVSTSVGLAVTFASGATSALHSEYSFMLGLALASCFYIGFMLVLMFSSRQARAKIWSLNLATAQAHARWHQTPESDKAVLTLPYNTIAYRSLIDLLNYSEDLSSFRIVRLVLQLC